VVSIARITFTVGGSPESSTALGIEIHTLVDTNGEPIAADTQGCIVGIGGATPTHGCHVEP
jgi:hypothetical protein